MPPPSATLAALVAELLAQHPRAPLRLRRMLPADLPAVMAIQAACYPASFHETPHTMALRVRAYPVGQWVAEAAPDGAPPSPDGNRVVAYAQSHPWTVAGPPPCLDDAGLAARIAASEARHVDAYYHLHDVACALPGRGVGRELLATAVQHAVDAGYARAGLVAVLGMHTLWAKSGFVARRELTDAAYDCYAYAGTRAVWMDMALREADSESGGALH